MLLALFLGSSVALGQALPEQERPLFAAEPYDEVGLPFFYEHYSRQAYRRHQQNWSVLQNEQGVVYVANFDGILEYDGVSWRFIETALNTVTRSLAVDADGTVYAGAQGDFGYLAPDSTGSLQYVSLLDKVAAQYHDFSDVWGTHAVGEAVYFQAPERLFRWDGNEMKVWESEEGFHTSFVVNTQFFVREFEVGLLQLVDGGLQLVPGGRRFAEERIYMMAPYGANQVLIATREDGFFLYDGTSITPFPTEVDAYLKTHRLYHGTALPGGLYALATLDGGGIVLMNEQGQLVHLLNEPAGVLDDWVNHVYADAQGGLWLALDNQGVVRIDIPAALSLYNRERNLDGYFSDILRHQGRLYAATTKGLYVLNETPLASSLGRQRASFKQIFSKTSWSLLSADSVLFVGTEEGLFVIRDEAPEEIDPEESQAVYNLLESAAAPGKIYLARGDGLALLEHTGDGWHILNRIAPVNREVRWLAQEEDDVLWASTADNRVLRLTLAEDVHASTVAWFTTEDGVPEGDIGLSSIDEEVVVVSVQGVYRLADGPDAQTGQRFYRDTSVFASPDTLLAFTSDDDGNFWIVYPDRVEVARSQDDGTFVRETPDVLRFPKANMVRVHAEEDGIVWIGNGDKLIRYDSNINRRYDTAYFALVRKVTSARTGQVLFGGASSDDAAQGAVATVASLPVYDDIHNDLRFEFAAPSFNDVEETQYQYYLEGHDDGWSDWTYRTAVTYTDLNGKPYQFRVRARNAQGIVSQEAVFAFRVLPPWYRTWWAYALYLVLVVVGVGLAWRYRIIVAENKQAQEQARELARERVVNERLQQANKRLQEANESLMQVNKLKDEFLATTSHELRTPLTAILGFTSVLQEELPDHYTEFLDPIESNGRRLLQTVNSLLELAKLRSGMMELQREVLDVGTMAVEVNRLLTPLALQKKLALQYRVPSQPVYVNLDRRFLERILNNLIGNAIKFTEEGSVSVDVTQDGERVVIRVADTGIGIDEDFIPYLFDEFKQESSGLARSHEGSGLGLSITARLVELLEGTIDVESKKGQGSVFTVTFPLHRPPVAAPVSVTPQTVVMH